MNLYDFKNDLKDKGIFFSFCGPISQSLMIEIGDILKQKLKLVDASSTTVLKVFSSVIEQSQNIMHYSAEKAPTATQTNDEKNEISFGIINVGFQDDHYYVMGGNEIENSRVEKLKGKLNKIQKMNKEELKAYYKEKRRGKTEADSKGAGLGFIEMARKSSRPIEFHFKKINDKISFFSFKSTI